MDEKVVPQAFGYVGVRAKDLSDWASYGSGLLGLQRVDKSRASLAFRMDDRKQRIIVHADDGEGIGFFGWEVADAAALDTLAGQLESARINVARGARALADERHVRDLIRRATGSSFFMAPRRRRSRSSPAARFPAFAPGRSASDTRCSTLIPRRPSSA
jgi:hypothetical protein